MTKDERSFLGFIELNSTKCVQCGVSQNTEYIKERLNIYSQLICNKCYGKNLSNNHSLYWEVNEAKTYYYAIEKINVLIELYQNEGFISWADVEHTIIEPFIYDFEITNVCHKRISKKLKEEICFEINNYISKLDTNNIFYNFRAAISDLTKEILLFKQ